ncbi:hypothetical protein D0Z07_9204 [Hyphodiscus hymeniophilus]|uniref:Uncharacterized protein n=1 Tax=Hyphodiscus hymeniophilus TaxID=353542 RepID=A0A9P6SJZ7_9HELO|nr:hypothetical protein D0Z07_9204 [Hyphodiscus hymeniophilus]
MSIPQQDPQTPAPCGICHERSTWDFLRDFYSRVEAAHGYARSLENDLDLVRFALLQCESSLNSSWERLNEERLEYRAAQEELVFERERHKETMDMLEKMFHEAMRSGQIADFLSGEIATLRAAMAVGDPRPLSEKPKSPNENPVPRAASILSSPRRNSGATQIEKKLCSPTGRAPPESKEREYVKLPVSTNSTEASAPRSDTPAYETRFKPTKNEWWNMSKPTTSRAPIRPKQSAPPIPPRTKPPGVNRLDHLIYLGNGSTSVLEFSPQRVQLAKQSHPLDLSVRVEELTRELGQLRQEIIFYRQGFENLQRLRETCYDVYQQLFLANYLDQNFDRLNELIIQLHHGLEDSVRREGKAEKSWLEFWGIEYKDKEAEGELI